MSESWLDNKPNCFIEFRVNDEKRFEVFMRFFDPMKAWTQNLDADNPAVEPYDDDATLAHVGFNQEDTQEHFAVSAREETKERREFAKPEEWLLAFRPQDLELLGMPAHAPSINALRSWQGLSRRERRKAIKAEENVDELRMLADFNDMLRLWQDVEFELMGCDKQSDRARITFSTFGFPYQGKPALEEMLMFFGFFSIITDTC